MTAVFKVNTWALSFCWLGRGASVLLPLVVLQAPFRIHTPASQMTGRGVCGLLVVVR